MSEKSKTSASWYQDVNLQNAMETAYFATPEMVAVQMHDRHRSRQFISLLKELDEYYPPECIIRVILDNHSAHISKETMTFLKTKPSRFVYLHTPKHGSWFNLVETLFGKMARNFPRHIRVDSKAEFRERVIRGIAEINASPVVHRWKKIEESIATAMQIY